MEMVSMRNSMGTLALLSIVLTALLSGTGWGGDLEPSAPPGPTMKTLDQIPPTWSQMLPAATRFQLVLGGAAVLDKETGLVWEQSPSTTTEVWVDAQFSCWRKTVGGRQGFRLPTYEELRTLVDPSQSPALPSGHPFINVNTDLASNYWSLTDSLTIPGLAYVLSFSAVDIVMAINKNNPNLCWCVRGGSGRWQWQ
jgi:hypothetical protein